jgi:predicted MPP superfamily phosphohydrolase
MAPSGAPAHLAAVKRRAFLGAAAAAGGGLLSYGAWIEPRTLDVSFHALRLSRAGAAASEEGEANSSPDRLRLVQISDLHLKRIDSFHETLALRVDALRPDLLLFTGDTVDESTNVPLVGEMLSLLRTGAPRIGVMGNWEYWGEVTPDALGEEFLRGNGLLLVNRSVEIDFGGRMLLVTGLDDWLAGSPDPVRALPPASIARERGHQVVLAHCPVHRDVLASSASDAAPAPWVLSGHTHGGQVWLPGLHVTPRGSGHYLKGWYRGALPHLYVSRGIGTSRVPLRVGSRPEVAVFDVELA